MHVCALFALFHVFMFRSMLVCLNLGLRHVLVCSSLCGFMARWSFGATYFFGCIRPLLWLVWMQPCLRVHPSDVWFACHQPFSPLLSFACQGFLCQPLYVPYNMLTLPLCVITCLLCLLCAISFGILCFLASLHLLSICSCMHLCVLVYVIKLSSYLTISCGFTLVFVHEILSPFQELCLKAHVCRSYSNILELWTLNPNLHLSLQDSLFRLITCMIFFPCFSLCGLPLFFVISFACLLALFYLLLLVHA